jgi:hypothetical protein
MTHNVGRAAATARTNGAMRMSLLVVLLILVAPPLYAQPIQISPANPTTNDVVQLLYVPQFNGPGTVTQTGNAFRIDVPPWFFESPEPPITLGLLPAGTYTYTIYQSNQPFASGSFIVTAAPAIPTLSTWSMLALAVLLSMAGCVALGRYNFL